MTAREPDGDIKHWRIEAPGKSSGQRHVLDEISWAATTIQDVESMLRTAEAVAERRAARGLGERRLLIVVEDEAAALLEGGAKAQLQNLLTKGRQGGVIVAIESENP